MVRDEDICIPPEDILYMIKGSIQYRKWLLLPGMCKCRITSLSQSDHKGAHEIAVCIYLCLNDTVVESPHLNVATDEDTLLNGQVNPKSNTANGIFWVF